MVETLKCTNQKIINYNWDLRSVKNRYLDDPYFFHSDILKSKIKKSKPYIAFDEIHKFPKWKDILKDYYDSFHQRYEWLVTGSARLDLFRKSGDSLSGRYVLFKLFPIVLSELSNRRLILPLAFAKQWLESLIVAHPRSDRSYFEQMIQFGSFPEPLFKADAVFSKHWHEQYIDTLVREDIRDLTRIHDLENIMTLIKLLPQRIGAPLSINNLQKDLKVSYTAVKNYVNALFLTYVLFEIPPYSEKIARTVQKEKKIYFMDFSLVQDEAKRFENYVALELNHWVNYFNALTVDRYELYYVRTHSGKESDFLITRNEEPYVLFEVKMSESKIDAHHLKQAQELGNIPFVQILYQKNILKAAQNSWVISADWFF